MSRWRCPSCFGDDLRVVVSVTARLIQEPDGNFQTDPVGDHEWDEFNPMKCETCDFDGEARDFEAEDGNTRCPDCGEVGYVRGHMGCQYPSDAIDHADHQQQSAGEY